MIIRLAEAIFISIVAGGIGTIAARKLAHEINKHYAHEDKLDEKEREND